MTVLNYRSNWDSGKTWKSSLRTLSELTGLSIRYLRDTLSSLTDMEWVPRLTTGTNTGSRYQVTHHNCSYEDIPTDKNGNPLKCAIPQGKGSILDRLFNGDISWKAALIWILLKLHSNWKTGTAHSVTDNAQGIFSTLSKNTLSAFGFELDFKLSIQHENEMVHAKNSTHPIRQFISNHSLYMVKYLVKYIYEI